jgi:pyrophosphatase PpaX
MTFKLMIWDLDNTLIGSSKLLWGAFNMVFEKYAGTKLTPNEIVQLYGPPEGDVIERIVGRQRKNQALEDFYTFYRENHDLLINTFSRVFDLIGKLRQGGIKQSLFTSKGRRSVDITLERLGIDKLFDFVVCGDEILRPKPNPDGVIKILSYFSLSPEEVIYFGDSPLDIQSAHQAGVKGALVLWDSIHQDALGGEKPDFIFLDIPSLEKWVEQYYAWIE